MKILTTITILFAIYIFANLMVAIWKQPEVKCQEELSALEENHEANEIMTYKEKLEMCEENHEVVWEELKKCESKL